MKHRFLYFLLFLFFLAFPVHAETEPWWIFFTDRGPIDIKQSVAAKTSSASEPKNLSRRARIMGGNLFDERDLPVYGGYIAAVQETAGAIRTVTRYFNGVSVDVNTETLEILQSLPFVKNVRPVTGTRETVTPSKTGTEKPGIIDRNENLPYGNSYNQVNAVGAVELHNLGYMGEGILIAVLDSGFDNLEHAAFDSIRISHTRDFLDNDDNPDGHDHGSKVLAISAALDYGNMIGVAPYATYLLARTEIMNDTDIGSEEDYWIAGLEWADSLGADIVNSSLGYFQFEDKDDYTYADLDGTHALTTLAADIAVEKGIVVVTSAGNEGDSAWYYITTPADGFNVLAVGSVDERGVISPSSSHGPTYDGRIKPDFTAHGRNIWLPRTTSKNLYYTSVLGGTSFAAPALSGAVALILEANPSWTPADVKQSLITTSLRGSENADNEYGYGAIDAYSASEIPQSIIRVRSPFGNVKWESGGIRTITWEQRNVDTVAIEYSHDGGSTWELMTANADASEGFYDWTVPDVSSDQFKIRIRDVSDFEIFATNYGMFTVYSAMLTFKAFHPYPQPLNFNKGNRKIFFPVEIPAEGTVSVRIYNFTGETIKTIENYYPGAGSKRDQTEAPNWDGTNFTGDDVAPGIYYYTIQLTGHDTHTGKIAVIR